MSDELKSIFSTFADSGWDLIANPSKRYLQGECSKEELLKAVKQADEECGSCGCAYDDLYKRVLNSKDLV